MRKIYTIILLLLVSTTLLIAQNELVIEVTTDKYASETSWSLFDTNKELIETSTGLEDQTTHKDTIQLDETNCYFWTIYDSYGDGMSSPGSPGDYKLFYNGALIAQCTEPNFGDSISVYGIGANCAVYDVSIEEVLFKETQSFSPFALEFKVLNFGSELITEMEASYEIDGTESEVFKINDLAIEFGTMSVVSIPEEIQIKQAGNYTVSINIKTINNVADEDNSNNTIITNVEVLDGFWKKPIHEEFTANWCGPCAAANPILDATLAEFPGQYSLIKYQYYNDNYYAAHGGNMATFYGVGGIPAMYVNASYQYPGEYTPEVFETNMGHVTDLNLALETEAVGDSIFVNATIEASKDISKEGYVRLAVVENTTTGNIGSNGETEFYNVFMRFLTAWDGDEIGTLSQGETVILSFSGSMENTFVEEMSDLSVIAYIFYQDSYEILQSEMVEVPYIPVPPTITFNINNNETDVDTMAMIEVSSNKPLQNLDGSEITNFDRIITFTEETETENIEFEASISDDFKTITVTPNSALKASTQYRFELMNVQSGENIQVENTSILFTTQTMVGIENYINKATKLYPNPVSDYLYIDTDLDSEIEVMNISGEVLHVCPTTKFSRVDFSNFSKGIYFVKIKYLSNYEVFKVCKQ